MSYVPMYQKMRELLKSSRIKQNELARRMGKNTSSISDMLTGKKRISIEEFFAFCEAVEVHPSKLFEDFESKREERLQELWNQRLSEVDRKDEGGRNKGAGEDLFRGYQNSTASRRPVR